MLNLNGRTEPAWVVWNPQRGAPTHIHDDPDEARLEAERLAARQPGESFHVFAWVGTAQHKTVEWIEPDDIPF